MTDAKPAIIQMSGEPIEIVLALPMPPSTNRIWRSAARKVYRSEQYLIGDDKHCRRLSAAWGNVEGCRVVLRELHA